MRPRRTYTRSLALFVVAFLCLNPGAVLCLAYCNSHTAQADAAHCPLKKAGADCPHSRQTTTPTDKPTFDTGSAKGCVMPVNIIAAPLESKVGSPAAALATVNIEHVTIVAVALVRSRQIPKFYYPPPPNDGRLDRVRNQVFRI